MKACSLTTIFHSFSNDANRYKMVDSRMKKEMRATKRIAKKAKGSNRRK